MSGINTTNTPPPPPPRTVRELFRELAQALRKWFRELLDLREGLDREGAIIYIKNNKRMQGANAWLLGCSIMIASLGLDLNSPAVIIGAMLVSPLMSPILGIGLGVSINDKDTLLIGLRHFGIAILIALVTSTLYFYITPFGELTSEIRSRTSPTVLDGLVAVFGGLAGIISVTRKDMSNAIPGVAIATALMPPLCVTGFGLAELLELYTTSSGLSPEEFRQSLSLALGIIGGSFYLFFLNSFFIALMAYLIIRFLGFPYTEHVDEREARRNRIIITFFSLVIIFPSAWILYNLYLQQQDKKEAAEFVSDYFEEACIKYDLTRYDPDTNKLILQLLGRRIPQDSLSIYEKILAENYHLHKPTKLFPVQAELSMDELRNLLQAQKQEVVGMMQAERVQAEQAAKERELLAVAAERRKADSLLVIKSLRVAREAFPDELSSISYTRTLQEIRDTSLVTLMPTYLVKWERGRPDPEILNRLENMLRVAAELDTLQVVSY
ncbi:MAG: DUF389 domain-containing protein [Lewinellaceae bacterium]|nr:DUF389 domain-containing protein [Lewinellaceae bacterium]MCB9287121.1 DUF389 domain-containing protein [Lewinellaceae bacterium]